MAEIVACPNCQRPLQIPESFRGQMVQCPDCQHSFEATAASSAVQASPPTSSSIASKPFDDADDRPRTRRRRFEDDDEDDREPPRRRRRNFEPHRGTIILTLGILSIFIAPLILGTIAWILGNNDLRAIHEGRMDPEGESQTRTGRNIGMVMVCLYVLILIAVFGFVGIMIATEEMR
jgi:hypothetical protein